MNMVWITFSASDWGTLISQWYRFLLLHLSCSGNVPHSDLWLCGSPNCYPSWELDFHWVRTSFHRLYYYKAVGNNQVYQGSITFTNVLQGNDTVVLVDCTIEWEPDITCNRQERNTNVSQKRMCTTANTDWHFVKMNTHAQLWICFLCKVANCTIIHTSCTYSVV